MADPRSVLIVGERPERNDFSDPALPKGMTPEKIRDGIPGLMRLSLGNGSRFARGLPTNRSLRC